MSDFWSNWIILLTVVSIIGYLWLLFGNRSRPNTEEKTTGHIYDGIEEYDNPMPSWWLYLFVLTIVFSIAYLALYPGLGNFKGFLGWTQEKQWQQNTTEQKAKFSALLSKYAAMPIEELAKNEQARRSGQHLFAMNCAACHGSDAGGNVGFPNLRDDEWLYGGSPEMIKMTITEGRRGTMPAWKNILNEQQVNDVAAWVAESNPAKKLPAGAQVFASYCSVCHGADGKGDQKIGAPNLTNNIWLYGGALGEIKTSILNGRSGQMPSFKHLLSAEQIHLLTAYIYGLNLPDEASEPEASAEKIAP